MNQLNMLVLMIFRIITMKEEDLVCQNRDSVSKMNDKYI